MSARTTFRSAWAGLVLLVLSLLVIGSGCADDPPSAVVGLSVAGCPPGEAHGTGTIVAPGLVLTSAHVVKGADEIRVTNGDWSTTGTIAAFDPNMDLAYVRLDSGTARPLRVDGSHVERGDAGAAYVFRGGEVQVIPVRVRRPVQINTEDIYIKDDTNRPGYELDADIQAGDSGGPVIIDGVVVGVLWARSSKFESRAYAIDPVLAGDLIRSQLESGQIAPDIDLSRCN
jgi:S1-C subfamily serine protease